MGNYPSQWTVDSSRFWSMVLDVKPFSDTVFEETFAYLKKFFSCEILCDFLQQRCKVASRSKPSSGCAEEALSVYVKQFEACMRARHQNFITEAAEMMLIRKGKAIRKKDRQCGRLAWLLIF